jgi:ribosomal protein S18 acetylase RimI-like enzyme
MQNQQTFTITTPREGDEQFLAPMHIQSWKETYLVPQSGLTEEIIDGMLGHMLTNTDFRKNTIAEALANPNMVLYRVVRNSNDSIVGFLHGSKHEMFNELDAIYLLNEVKGSGTGEKLMEEFLTWADKNKPCRLEVFSFNDRAINFYTKYGFVKTDKPEQLYKERLPFIEMVKPSQ